MNPNNERSKIYKSHTSNRVQNPIKPINQAWLVVLNFISCAARTVSPIWRLTWSFRPGFISRKPSKQINLIPSRKVPLPQPSSRVILKTVDQNDDQQETNPRGNIVAPISISPSPDEISLRENLEALKND
jgi:hypothetical protein